MKPITIGLVLLVAYTHHSLAREITNSDIKDAMLSLLNIVRTSDNKLERHESRERALGEQLKKSLASLEKGHRSLDPLKGAVSRLDERLSNVETILIQKDEREKQQTDKTNESIAALKSSLQQWSDNISNVVRTEIKAIPKPILNNTATDMKLEQLEKNFNKKIDSVISFTEDILKKFAENIKANQPKPIECKKSNLDEEMLNKHFAQIEKLFKKLDTKIAEQDKNITKLQSEILPLNEIAVADEAWHSKMTNVLEKQNQDIKAIEKSLSNTQTLIKAIPVHDNTKDCNNQTIEAIHKVKYELMTKSDEGISIIKPLLLDVKSSGESLQKELTNNITESCKATDETYNSVIKSYDQLKFELQSLPKVEKVMIQTADNVLDVKRKIEHAIHQIGENVKMHNTALNNTIYKRFDDIELSIADTQADALGNLSKKIEHEMSQVWRQIGIMYQQLSSSSTVLDRLQAQTEQYVNGSVSTMDGMEGKVSLITKRMSEIDENLNYLLGRLSLVTQEFDMIREGLGSALDKIKSSFQIVQSKIKDSGPGPHKIDEKALT
ncbi:uncharacterized protein LOC143918355 [Arctopsyche grandis]|uniref:uncharacterized protein LOC143918355 n=1 Tax=Arctopsyche grandis TaxID=121162 RepID=UPI00406D95BB